MLILKSEKMCKGYMFTSTTKRGEEVTETKRATEQNREHRNRPTNIVN